MMTKCGESCLELEAFPSILSAAVHGIDHLFVDHTFLWNAKGPMTPLFDSQGSKTDRVLLDSITDSFR